MNEIPADDVEALIEIFAGSRWTELHLVVDGLELTLSNDAAYAGSGAAAPAPPVARGSASLAAAAPAPTPSAAMRGIDNSAADADLSGLTAVRAPNLGHFYRAPRPGAPPFVEVGSRVGVDDIVCVIEVMKLFTLLPAGISGIVRAICVDDSALVEFDQPLMYIEPDA